MTYVASCLLISETFNFAFTFIHDSSCQCDNSVPRAKVNVCEIRHNFDTIGYLLAIVFCPCNAFAFGGRLIFDKKSRYIFVMWSWILMRLVSFFMVLLGLYRQLKKILGWTFPIKRRLSSGKRWNLICERCHCYYASVDEHQIKLVPWEAWLFKCSFYTMHAKQTITLCHIVCTLAPWTCMI